MSAAQRALDEYESKPTAELIRNAKQLIYAMCQDGAATHWRMSIPVQPGDSDIILTAALKSAEKCIAELEAQNALLRAVAEAADKTSEVYHGRNVTIEAVHVEFTRLDGHLQKAIDGGAMGDDK